MYHYQYQHNYLPTPLPPTLTEQEVGRRQTGEITSETQSHSHSYSFTSRPVIRGITSRMNGFKVNKLAVNGNNFGTEVVYLVSVIRVIGWLSNSLLSSITTLLL